MILKKKLTTRQHKGSYWIQKERTETLDQQEIMGSCRGKKEIGKIGQNQS